MTQFDCTPLDLHSGDDLSHQCIYSETQWGPQGFNHCSVLELGSGAIRFSKVFLPMTTGVLQRTPSFSDSVTSLIRNARVDGEVLVDFYPIKGWYTKFHSKYLFRLSTKRLPKPLLLKLIRFNIGWMLALSDLLFAYTRLRALSRSPMCAA